MKVRDAMSRTAVTVRLDTSLREAHAVFARSQVDVLAVVGRDESGWMRRVIGVLTRADLLRTLRRARTRRALTLLATRDVADVVRRVRALKSHDSLGAATLRLLEAGIDALPVTGPDGSMAGMLSLRDVFSTPLAAAR